MSRRIVRSSSLTGYPDCERMWSARQLPDLIADAGFTLRQVPNNIGARIGTAVHKGAAHMLLHKIETGELAARKDSQEAAIEQLRTDCAEGVVWDDTSPKMNDAEMQTLAMVQAYHLYVAPQIRPVAVEQEMRVQFGQNLEVLGHMDVAEHNQINDTKSGKMRRPNHPQYGSYSMMWRAHGATVNRFFEDYVPRVSIRTPQPMPERHEYDVAACEQAAHAVLKRIDQAIDSFQREGDKNTFIPNPASVLCSDRFCPAHSTGFCAFGKR